MAKKYVIIGNGTAAVGCIEGIRAHDLDGSITVISAENHPAYCRPLISYYLEGKAVPERMSYRPDDFYDKNGVKVIYGESAEKIDTDSKSVVLSNGEKVAYDSICVATGSRPLVPPFEGLETVPQKFPFMTLDDAQNLESAISEDSDVFIVGAGLIGLKCAEGLYGRVKSITVCDLADRVMPSILDAETAEMMKKCLEDNGLKLMLSDTATKFDGNVAYMKSGAEVKFDVLVLAVGVKANISLVKDAGGECGRGITVDNHMATSLSDIYAAGDCAESMDYSSGNVKVMAIMPNAYMQGHCAGENMAGADVTFDNGIPMNAIGFFGLHVMSAGTQDGELYEEKSDSHIKKLFTKDDRLVGFILAGDTTRAGIYTNLIRNGISLSSIDFDTIKSAPNIFSFGQEYCRNSLGGVV
ncbi:MAG: FAD-dependent oxidoreductase [Oscillospiraceae bacterium]|nr:FAD-dependent oxidoreductase [Oscillospiraceae bacterium]